MRFDLPTADTYATYALAYLAKRPGKTVPSHGIAGPLKLPERFLLKVLKPLVDADLLISVKGPNGGYRLRRPPSEISLLEILCAYEPARCRICSYVADDSSKLGQRLKNACDQTMGAIRKNLGAITLSDLIK